jgi:hypothetical protein
MDREIIVSLTPKIIRKSFFYQFRGNLFIAGIILLFILSVIVHLKSIGSNINWGNYSILAVFSILICAVPYRVYRRFMNQIRKMNSPLVRYRITDDRFYVESDLASGQNSWAVFKDLQKYPKIWLLVTQGGSSFILPAELLDEELKQFLSDKVLSKSSRSKTAINKFHD